MNTKPVGTPVSSRNIPSNVLETLECDLIDADAMNTPLFHLTGSLVSFLLSTAISQWPARKICTFAVRRAVAAFEL